MEELLAALWTGDEGRIPPEYFDLLACRMYGCTPSQLDAEEAARVCLHLAFAGVEGMVAVR